MQIPQISADGVHVRRLQALELEELEAVQDNKNRRYVQVEAGSVRGDFSEIRSGALQLFRERLTGSVHLAGAPTGFYAAGIVLGRQGPLSFCGQDLPATTLAQASAEGWHLRTTGPVDYICISYDMTQLERHCSQLLRTDISPGWLQSRVLSSKPAAVGPLMQLVVESLARADCGECLPSSVGPVLESEVASYLLRALQVNGNGTYTIKDSSRRRASVRIVLDYLREVPDPDVSMQNLCTLTQVSERTLEYAFMEAVSLPPRRYLKLLRLNQARNDLLDGAAHGESVTDVALRRGFSELGRFAGEYRALFGERPSTTLKRSGSGCSRNKPAPEEQGV